MQEEVAGGLVKLQVVLAVLGDDSRWYWRDGRSCRTDSETDLLNQSEIRKPKDSS